MDKRIYEIAAQHIIDYQVAMVGPIAKEMAQRVSGLVFGGKCVKIEGDPIKVLERLAATYETLFGGLSLIHCKNALVGLYLEPNELPKNLVD